MVFNVQPRDIYIWPMSDRTYKMQAVIYPNSSLPITTLITRKVERKLEFILENSRGRLVVAR